VAGAQSLVEDTAILGSDLVKLFATASFPFLPSAARAAFHGLSHLSECPGRRVQEQKRTRVKHSSACLKRFAAYACRPS
jgi:hypothetical protein